MTASDAQLRARLRELTAVLDARDAELERLRRALSDRERELAGDPGAGDPRRGDTGGPGVAVGGGPAVMVITEIIPLAELERRYVLEVLERCGGNRTHAARALGIGANTLWRKLKSWGVPSARDGS